MNIESRSLLITAVFVLIFGVWFFAIKDVFSPFVLSVLLMAFLMPFREEKSIRVLMALIFTLSMIGAVHYLQDIITPFVISFALAYLFDPLADFFERRKLSRTTGILVVTVFIVGTLVLFGLLVIPQFTSEVLALTSSLPSYEQFKRSFNPDSLGFLQSLGIDVHRLFALMETESIKKMDDTMRYFTEGATNISSGLGSLITQLLNLILIPFATFYFLRDFDKNLAYLKDRTPERHRHRFEKIYGRINTILTLYIRGKLLASGVIMFLTWIVLAVMGIEFALVMAMLTGFFSLFPYVGMILTFALGVLIGLINPAPESAILKIMLVILIIQILDMVIISPKVIGEKLGMHPVLLIFSLFVFGKLLGVFGLLIAIPASAIIKVFAEEWYEKNFFTRGFIGDTESKTTN